MDSLTYNEMISTEKSLYDTDFYQWTLHNANLLRQGRLSEIDIENLAEEIESMGRRDRRELESRLAVLIMHLLKLQYQSEKQIDSKSWATTIRTQRKEIVRILRDSPSLKHNIETTIGKEFITAKEDFEEETGISRKKLPEICPYTFDQIIDKSFWPKPIINS
ncbi:MAG: DUF29 domain-containing protein [Candidatus Magnetoovum sp. WYHC-5]|nr:DUF29 domain-containing protein [Candidatus Magnetoovum sp. WYHC-5]